MDGPTRSHSVIKLLAVAASLAVFSAMCGCATTAPSTGTTTARRTLPQWVRIVSPSQDGRALFVGGVSSATDRDSAVALAEADAQSQLHVAAVGRFSTLFSSAVASSKIETSGLERMDFKRLLSDEYASRLVDASVRDTVFVMPCGEGLRSGESGAASGSARAGSAEEEASGANAEAVCRAFVRISLDESEWNRVLAELLATEERRRRDEGQQNLAELAEWMLRDVLHEDPVKEHDRQ